MSASPPELDAALEELLPHIEELAIDSCGAAVVVSLLTKGTLEQR